MLLCITYVCTQVPCDKRGPGVQAGGFQEASRRAHRTAWQVAGPESHGSAQGGECNHRAADPIQGVPGFPGKATAKLRLKAERDLGESVAGEGVFVLGWEAASTEGGGGRRRACLRSSGSGRPSEAFFTQPHA